MRICGRRFSGEPDRTYSSCAVRSVRQTTGERHRRQRLGRGDRRRRRLQPRSTGTSAQRSGALRRVRADAATCAVTTRRARLGQRQMVERVGPPEGSPGRYRNEQVSVDLGSICAGAWVAIDRWSSRRRGTVAQAEQTATR